MAASPPLLETASIRRTAEDGTVLLDDVSLQIPPGSTTAIVGSPGAGKTLLLRSLGLLDPLDEGDVLFRGKPIADHDVPAVRRQVILLQQRPILVEGTVRENLRLPFNWGVSHSAGYDEQRVLERLTETGRNETFLNRNVSDLSGGESQIVSLLRALQLEPSVLLLDEPTSSLDGQTTGIVERLIEGWRTADAERALVVVTHSGEQASRLAERTLSMSKGRLATNEGASP